MVVCLSKRGLFFVGETDMVPLVCMQKKGPIMLIPSSTIALQGSLVKIILIYLVLGLGAAPQVILPVLVLAPLHLGQLSSNWLPLEKVSAAGEGGCRVPEKTVSR